MTVTPPDETRAAAAVPPAPEAAVPSARTAAAPDGASSPELAPPTRRFLAKATLITVVLSLAGALLGLGRDQSLARLFGAGSETDAFLVAWTVPEFAATLLIEDGLAFVLVPAFSAAVARRARGAEGDPVRALLGTTLPRLCLGFVAASALLIAGAPYLVEALAPGLPDPQLAVDCTRLTSTCVLSFGLAGYCSAALRAHRRFVAPAAIYVAYNVGIITAMFTLGGHWGVRSAALGVAFGGVLMVLTQLPSLWRELRAGRRGVRARATATAKAPATAITVKAPAATKASGASAASGTAAASETGAAKEPPTAASPKPLELTPDPEPHRPVDLALIAPVLLFALTRQSQVLVERFLASSLPAGAISHLNYAQKVAQMPMTLSLMLCTVTFPVVARALAEGDVERARTRVERDLALVSCTVLLGTAVVIACAPEAVRLLFQRGAFTAHDTAATATVMRVYALGLLGQTLVGALVRSYFSGGRPTWYPLFAITTGVVTTSCIATLSVGSFGVLGIAAANAVGITLSAVILLVGMGTRSVPIRTRAVVTEIGKPVRAAAVAALVGAWCASRTGSPSLGLAVGIASVTAVFLLLARLFGIPVPGPLASVLRSATRRLPHVRFR